MDASFIRQPENLIHLPHKVAGVSWPPESDALARISHSGVGWDKQAVVLVGRRSPESDQRSAGRSLRIGWLAPAHQPLA